jgi:hypothetical protein
MVPNWHLAGCFGKFGPNIKFSRYLRIEISRVLRVCCSKVSILKGLEDSGILCFEASKKRGFRVSRCQGFEVRFFNIWRNSFL